MPGQNDKLSQTMRIDLIPDTPAETPSAKKEGVVVAQPTRRHRRVAAEGEDRERSGYEELLQNIYDAALVTDLKGAIKDVNVRAEEFTRHSRDELCSMTIFDIVHGADESLVDKIWQNLEEERFTVVEAYCMRKDGTFFPSEIAVNKLRLEDWRLCFFVRDITRRRQQEEMLRTEHNAIQNAGNGIAVAGLDASLEYVNPAVAAMWGIPETKDLIGRNVRELIEDGKAAEEMLNAVLKEGNTWSGEVAVEKGNGNRTDIQVSAARNRNSEGRTVGMILSFVDISDRKRAETATREAERQRVMLESVGAACHHLGQPATVLLANLGIIERQLAGSDETVRELVKASIQAAENLGKILHKLNNVNEYKTTAYLDKTEDADSMENRILDI
ncbi:MAG: PAS domain S-box protein [Kiritimatiellia bacterium]